MQILDKLACLREFCDEVFQHFYDELLSNKVFAKHFSNEDQIKALLVKQKENFLATLTESEDVLFDHYYRIGVIHYNHDIPYEVFLSGTHILRDKFNEVIKQKVGDVNLVLLNNGLFNSISAAMAKGYLDKYLRSERQDLEKILSMVRNTSFGLERKLLVKHYNWMLELLTAVADKNYDALQSLIDAQNMDVDTLYSYIEKHLDEFESLIKLEDVQRIRFRIIANTENIFFYLRRGAYSEVLSLIINILEIYKLTLVLDNVISNIVVRKAESVISEKVKLSETDPLTNVMNRRKFEDLLENLLLRAHRTALPLTIIIIDIDDFKRINDQFGHQTGDDVLVKIAHLISKSIRKNDHLVRYGGEEFVIISADNGLQGIAQLGEKIRKDIESYSFPDIGNVTVSMGIAEVNNDDDSVSLFKRADEKLYEAKIQGKNCVRY